MKFKALALTILLCSVISSLAEHPLRVFIRGGVKTHGPNQHDHPRFLGDWTKLLGERGIRVDGAMEFPTAPQLENTDVLVIYAADGMKIVGEQRAHFETFLQRGGGLVVIHDGVVSGDQHEWAKKVQGGAWIWENRQTKWYEGEVGLYFMDPEHPITRGISNFDWKDEIYYDLDMSPDVKVLATSFHSVFVVAPQIWTYEKTWEGGAKPYRAFVSLPGHEYDVFQTPHYRAILLRGLAWAGQRKNVDEFCHPEELASLQYPAGGPIAPAESASRLNLHPEFEINLVAAEPLVQNPISLDWDHQGRLWVAETPEYPAGRTIHRNDEMVALWAIRNPGQTPPVDKENRPARDRIAWLQDTNGDGQMDKKHVFADGLELITSLVPHKDGFIVAQAPDILWLRDKNGDGKCDMVEGSEKITLYTGFGTFDTHAVINNFRWGLDGWVYGAIGYSAGTPKSPDGTKDFGRLTAGIFRFKPDGSAVEQVASGSCNTWGFDFGPDGEAFYTTATCGEHFLHIVMPEKVLSRGNVGGVRSSAVLPDHQDIAPAVHHTRPAYVQIDWVGKFTAAAGCAIYNGGAWPERWNGSHFCSETTMSLVHHEFLHPKGVTFTASKEPGREDHEFIAGTDLWFRPIHTRVGPDGALYVIDFYNQAAIHNDTRGPKHGARNAAVRPDRDHKFGRIWRVQHKQAKGFSLPEFETLEAGQLLSALNHPNGWARDTAARLLREQGVGEQVRPLHALVRAANAAAPTRIAALHTAAYLNHATPEVINAALTDATPAVRKNALRIVSEREKNDSAIAGSVIAQLKNPDPGVRMHALIALGQLPVSDEIAREVVEVYPSLDDRWSQSAAIGSAAQNPLPFMNVAFRAGNPAALNDFVTQLARQIGQKQDAALAVRLVQMISSRPAHTDQLKERALASLAAALRPEVIPAWNDELAGAFKALLQASRPEVAGAALPLIARWDQSGSLTADVKPIIDRMTGQLQNKQLPDDQRAQIAVNLLGVRQLDREIVAKVAALAGSDASPALQRRVIDALGNSGENSAGERLVSVFTSLAPELQEPAFAQIVKRADWSTALLAAVQAREIPLPLLGPAFIHRLRTHSDRAVAERAVAIVDEIRGPQVKEKDALVDRLMPVVEQSGNLENGRLVFTQNCANCHKFKGEGSDLAPDLTGMGAHGAHDLLVHIIDPNRVVEPNFVSVSIETKDDQVIDGIIVRENASVVTLRNASAEYEIRQDNIASRRSTGLSVMPEGFEELGGEGLRDLIAYMSADENKYRILDMNSAFTANSTEGIYVSRESRNESLRFSKFGLTKVDGIPFEIVHPNRSTTGNNVVVLKGGSGYARTLPRRVEFRAGVAASKLHFLGGVGGWAWPWGGDQHKDVPIAQVTLHYADGATEEIILKNGVEFADYAGRAEVPGSKEAVELVRYGQVRWFTKPVGRTVRIDRISIESYENDIAPTFVAITVELSTETKTASR